MRSRSILIPVAAAMTLIVPARAQANDRFVLTTAQVADAITRAGAATTAAQVSMMAAVMAAEPAPALDILSITPVHKTQSTQTSPVQSPLHSLVRLGCHQPHICLPFYVTVNALHFNDALVTVGSSPGSGRTPRSEFTMPAGTHATLIMDDQRAHIQLAVVSLENGMTGKWIRVASPDHKQVYFGEVVNASLLRGAF